MVKALQLTAEQYREFSAIAKRFGAALNVSTAQAMGCWGQYSASARPACVDARDPGTKWSEKSFVTLADQVDLAALRAAGELRPETNWAALEDHEIYPFILWHEIGHRMDNFDQWAVHKIEEAAVSDKVQAKAAIANEILADRFAWSVIRPGEEIFLSASARRDPASVSETLQLVAAHLPRFDPSRTMNALPDDQYAYVPAGMLRNKWSAALIGPQVHCSLISEAVSNG